MSKWICFWLDTLTYFGLITSREIWEEIVKEKFGGRIGELRQLRSNFFTDSPDFGEGAKYTGRLTLGQWEKENGIDLSV